jgi:hypothetical protein
MGNSAVTRWHLLHVSCQVAGLGRFGATSTAQGVTECVPSMSKMSTNVRGWTDGRTSSDTPYGP